MAALTPTPANFITITPQAIIIDGAAKSAIPSTFKDGGSAVQLRRARTEESGFNWDSTPRHVILKNVLIHDGTDIHCLAWFIQERFKISFADNASTTYENLDYLVQVFESLKKRGVRVVEGSDITLPYPGGGSGRLARYTAAEIACQAIGFKTS